MNEFLIPEKDQTETSSGKVKNLKIHDLCFSFDEKEFACISSRYILLYSFDNIREKPSKNLYSEVNKN